MPRKAIILVNAVLLFILLALLPTDRAHARKWQGREEVLDGVTHVINPATPQENQRFVKPRKMWSLGGYSEADEEMFGMVRQIRTDSKGNIYVLDVQLNEIRVFSPEGEYLRTIGQEGEGPGDFRNATDFFITPDDRIGVIQMMPGRISMMTTDGDGLSDMPLPSGHEGGMLEMINGAQSSDNLLLMSHSTSSFSSEGTVSTTSLFACDHDGNVIDTFKQTKVNSPPGQVILSNDDGEDYSQNVYLASNNKTYLAPWYDEYKIEVLNEKGETERIITREFEPMKRSAEEIKAIRDRYSGFHVDGGAPDIDINPNRRTIGSLRARPNGEIWVITCRGAEERGNHKYGVFDVFDRKGRFVRNMSIDIPYDPDYDRVIIRDQRLFLLKEINNGPRTFTSEQGGESTAMVIMGDRNNDDDDREPEPFEIICYELPK